MKHLTHLSSVFNGEIALPASKSESNRAIVIQALAGGGTLTNLAAARDTQTMLRLITSSEPVADVLDAGTTMRFLTAYFAATQQPKTLTGTPRMQERPIGILVDALRCLGAEVTYLNKEGFPPIALGGLRPTGKRHLQMRGDVSSQFISAVLMIAPTLPHPLTVELTGAIGSVPYLEMTIAQMKHFGADVTAHWPFVTVQPRPYEPTDFAVEADWSGASYWYSLVALGQEGSQVELIGLKENSLQGDSAIVQIMARLGVKSTFTGRGFLLEKIPFSATFSQDFTHCPDLAQTVAVVCAALGVDAVFTGLESLKVKETDRVLALQNELAKFGAGLTEVVPCERYEIRRNTEIFPETIQIHTYEDHRMAMAFAPLALKTNVIIEDPSVVVKSYPSFWEDLATVGLIGKDI